MQVPHAKELLGVRLVLWRNAQGAWSCFEDKCPHRLAPLSGMPLLTYNSLSLVAMRTDELASIWAAS